MWLSILEGHIVFHSSGRQGWRIVVGACGAAARCAGIVFAAVQLGEVLVGIVGLIEIDTVCSHGVTSFQY